MSAGWRSDTVLGGHDELVQEEGRHYNFEGAAIDIIGTGDGVGDPADLLAVIPFRSATTGHEPVGVT